MTAARTSLARFVGLLLTACLLMFVATLRADDSAKLGVRLQNSVSGDEQPAILLSPVEGVKSLKISLTRDDGKTQTLTSGAIAAGGEKSLTIKQEHGKFSYTAQFSVTWADGSDSSFKMKFEANRTKKLELTIKPEDVDLEARVMGFRLNVPAGRAELIIFGKDDPTSPVKTIKKAFNGAAPGTKLELTWSDPGVEIHHLDLKVYDVAGFWKGVRLTPFSIHIPHDDVEFETAKWNIRKSEEPKLEDTMAKVRENLEAHGTLLTLKLYVAGYTDTVGDEASNKRLSLNRARSIATWFRKKGLTIPIHYDGFGEKVLAKPTPDETDEPRNRRALYVLSTQAPGGKSFPDADWKQIQ